MVSVAYSALWIMASYWFVKWKDWKLLYSTALFSSVANLLYEVICYRYPLWAMEPNGLPNVTLNILLLSLIGMPLSTMIYLSYFPFERKWLAKLLYISFFVVLFVVMEYFAVLFGSITYHNGWSLFHSFLFDIGMFTILYVHYKNPLYAWILSAILGFSIAGLFDITLDKMK